MSVVKRNSETQTLRVEDDGEQKATSARKRPPRRRPFKPRVHERNVPEPRDAISIDESEFDLCVLMWQSVIVQAFYDLANDSSNIDARTIRAEASSWFAGGDDFETVLDLAMVSKSQVKRMVKAILLEGEDALRGFNFRTVRKCASERTQRRTVRRNLNANGPRENCCQ